MSFSTHKYTRPVLVAELKKLSAKSFTDSNTLANAISPRAGRKSAKFAALRRFVNLNKLLNNGVGAINSKLNVIAALTSSSK